MERVERVVLIGFSGTGKSSVARQLAERLGWAAADSDDEIEREWGASIPAIFRDHGEAAFRVSERAALQRLVARNRVVIATGGGAAANSSAWQGDTLGRRGTLVVALDAEPETILRRLQEQAAAEGESVERPMLRGDDPLGRVRELKKSRLAAYDTAHLTLSTDAISSEDVVAELAAITRLSPDCPFTVCLEAASGRSDVHVAPGAASGVGAWTRERWPKAQRAWIVTDRHVGPLHAAKVERSLLDAGIRAMTKAVIPGEGSKSLATTGDLYDWLLGQGVERGDVIVAFGGGVVGDLAGFVAATVLRGIGLVQVPTSLLAAVDSSVGGKTGVNHRAGKNLIGAVLQPGLVVVDTSLLRTMPPRDLRSGWAEVVKHAVIQRSTPGGQRGDLATILQRSGGHLRQLEEPSTAYLVWRNILLKAAVVAEDEREVGIRTYLNFGHTIGHAIEAVDYQLLHGEAVAIGMRAAAELGVLHGSCRVDDARQIGDLISAFDLPREVVLDEARVLERMQSDKKRVAGRHRFVLPIAGGGVAITDDVSEMAVAQALAMVNSAKPAA